MPKATENIKLILTLSGYYIKLYSLWITKDLGGFLSFCYCCCGRRLMMHIETHRFTFSLSLSLSFFTRGDV